MADNTLRDELNDVFDRLNQFTELGKRWDFDEDIARVGKLMFAKQISDAFKPKVAKEAERKEKEKDKDQWLKDHLAAASTDEDDQGKLPNWNNYVKFKQNYANLLRNLLTGLNKLAKKQKWLDARAIADVFNKVNLRQMWRAKEQANASFHRALARMVKLSTYE